MMRPARIATTVFSAVTDTASPVRLRCRPMREPKISMAAMPSDRLKNAWPMAAYTASPNVDHPSANRRPKSGTR